MYSSTHLLALAYASELLAWQAASAGDEASSLKLGAEAVSAAHTYIYVVQVLMPGCGWATTKPAALIEEMGGAARLAAVLAVEWADEAPSVEVELARLASEKKPKEEHRVKKNKKKNKA